jgi:nucleoid-associated protein EbfC
MKLNMQSMLEQAQKVQKEMEKIKGEVSKITATADSGGGMVTASATGSNILTSIKISKEIVNPDDIEMLEDLVVAAVNKALNAASNMVQERMKSVSSMLPNIPGMNLDFDL